MLVAFIGDGEGKTSAAIGHAIRAAGHGKKVAVIQFLKGRTNTGEYKYFSKCPSIELYLAGESSFVLDKTPKETHTKKAKEGIALAKKLAGSQKYFLLILDEILDAQAAGLISTKDIGEIIDLVRVPIGSVTLHAILTGRVLPPELSKKIDLITQMKKIKHYYDLGDKGIEGLDW
ncbi:MAG: cob(I)yrinic acid a,c-diamide adenosyltransferase [Candidatus Saganbacteria bacterium]|nr:cob(I)yrinic acid a,c-diamide adenosyltransferase [Candidatus Saganbacteria bacterium]